MIEKDIGKRIQKYRKGKGITQEQLSEKIGISRDYYSKLERGMFNINLELLVNILNELECSADEVFCDVVDKSSVAKASYLSDKIDHLSIEEQRRIYEVIEVLIKNAK